MKQSGLIQTGAQGRRLTLEKEQREVPTEERPEPVENLVDGGFNLRCRLCSFVHLTSFTRLQLHFPQSSNLIFSSENAFGSHTCVHGQFFHG